MGKQAETDHVAAIREFLDARAAEIEHSGFAQRVRLANATRALERIVSEADEPQQAAA